MRFFIGVAALALASGGALSAQNLVVNGGFEAGDWTGWTISQPYGMRVFDATSEDATIHSGSFTAGLGSTPATDLSQTLATVAGQTYELSYWLQVRTSTPPNDEFIATIGDQTLFSGTNLPETNDYTEYSYVFVALSDSTTLTFTSYDPPSYFYLDDVSVTAVPEPSTCAAFAGLAVLGLCLVRRRFRR